MDWLSDSTLEPHQIQGSPAWLAFRAKHVGASDVPAAMGTCDFRTPYDVFLSKMPDYVLGEQTYPMIRGHALEPVTLALFEQKHACKLTKPTIGKGVMHASLDGWWAEERAVVEAKAPAIWKHTMALCGLVPDTYYDQLQAQMYCTDAAYAWYVSYTDNDIESHSYAEVRVERDERRIEEIVKTCEKFWKHVEERIWPYPKPL